MKKTFFLLVFISLTTLISALDISLSGTAGNFGIQENLNRTKAGDTAELFDMHIFELTLQDEISPNLFVIGALTRDYILQNGISAAASIQFNSVNILVGPYFTIGSSENDDLTSGDFLDTDNLFLPGILLGTEVGRQGHITGFFNMKSSLSQNLTDMSFKMYSLGLRFWVPNVICEVRFDQKKSQKPVSGVTTTQTDAGTYFDIFQKTLPFRFELKVLWRNISRSYESGTSSGNIYSGTFTPDGAGNYTGTMTPTTGAMIGSPGEDSTNYIIVGGGITVITSSSLQLSFSGECSIFTWYADDNQFLSGTPNDGILDFSATISAKYSLNRKKVAHDYSKKSPPPTEESVEPLTVENTKNIE